MFLKIGANFSTCRLHVLMIFIMKPHHHGKYSMPLLFGCIRICFASFLGLRKRISGALPIDILVIMYPALKILTAKGFLYALRKSPWQKQGKAAFAAPY